MRAAGAILFVLLAAGCQATTDSLGSNPSQPNPDATVPSPGRQPSRRGTAGARRRRPAPGHPTAVVPASVLQTELKLTDTTVTNRITSVYNQLFHGSASAQQPIYYLNPSDSTQAYIWDVLHSQVRTEGQGLGMMLAVELNHQDDFDHLWRYAKATAGGHHRADSAGYFNSTCDDADQMGYSACLDPFGFEQFVTALIFAHDRWGSTGAIDYQSDALALFHTMKHKVDDNGGTGTATNLFDATAHLPYAYPDTSYAGVTRPSIVMPGYYAVWAQADADDTFSADVTSGRALIQNAAWPTTGLTPIESYFTGKAVPGWDMFQPEAYRTQINIVIDQIWTGGTAEQRHARQQASRLLLVRRVGGINNYGTSYSLDGTPGTNPIHELSLVVSNAIVAGISTNSQPQPSSCPPSGTWRSPSASPATTRGCCSSGG